MEENEEFRHILEWTYDDVQRWISKIFKNFKGFSHEVERLSVLINVDGRGLLILRKDDILVAMKEDLGCKYSLKTKSLLFYELRKLQLDNIDVIKSLGYNPEYIIPGLIKEKPDFIVCDHSHRMSSAISNAEERPEDGTATNLKPEFGKTLISMVYLFFVTLITSFVMVIVHNRVPDMKKYPPLPDIFLNNVPHIPWAFAMCEWTATLMLIIWVAVLIFHKHRFILLRRFFAISGTVFLLRCCTMLITSLSVPGTHLQCNPMAEELQANDSIWSKMQQAYTIWSGVGMSIQGVRTCGDYMFSGHTSALTILNFFITEYTPRHLYFMHTFSWVLNMFGIFFILAAHEHYSIDVFIAFYITSRLFLYYHTLANNQALMQRDSTRTRIWFPLFSFFESEIDGIIPNEFETLASLVTNLLCVVKYYLQDLYRISMQRQIVLQKPKAE